jgi:hypothetical protein
MRNFFSRFSFFILALIFSGFFLTGCHYHFGYGDLVSCYKTISVPYAEGDKEGKLTAEVIKKISSTGALQFVTYGGDLTLKIKLLEYSDENIGFRYDRHKNGRLKKTLIPTETRISAAAEITLIERATKQIVRGPTLIAASVEFDHDFYSSRNAVNIFSLGQLSDIDASHETAMQPLNKELASKIADYILNSW